MSAQNRSIDPDRGHSSEASGEESKFNESVYRDIVELTGSFIVSWNASNNKISYCNNAFACRWGSSVDDLIGRSILEIRPEEDRIGFIESLDVIAPNGHQSEIYSHVDNGVTCYANVSVRAISRDGVNIDEYYAVGFDCTSESQYRVALDRIFSAFSDEQLLLGDKVEQMLVIGLAYFRADTAFVSELIRDVHEVRYRQSSSRLESVCDTSLIFPDTLMNILINSDTITAIENVSTRQQISQEGSRYSDVKSCIGMPINTGFGTYGALIFTSKRVALKPYSEHDSNFIKLVGNCISFLIGNEEQYSLVANLNDYYKSLMTRLPSMMFLTDADGLIISASDRLCTKFGFVPDQVPGEICFDLFKTSDKQALINAVTLDDVSKYPLSIEAANNQLIEVEINSSVKAADHLNSIRMVVMTDVSERNTATRLIEEQNKTLEAANDSLNKFAYIASHDLQEPMRKIQQFSQLLTEELGHQLSEDGQYFLRTITDASERMSELIKAVLSYSGTSREQLNKEPVSLSSIIDEVWRSLDFLVTESEATIQVGSMPQIQGDRLLLGQLFTNLISNSIKYCATTHSPAISINSFLERDQMGIRIVDNGIGFDMQQANSILEPFKRLHRSSEHKGNGIGLAICDTVCKKHGWTLLAESELDVGSTFTILFNKGGR